MVKYGSDIFGKRNKFHICNILCSLRILKYWFLILSSLKSFYFNISPGLIICTALWYVRCWICCGLAHIRIMPTTCLWPLDALKDRMHDIPVLPESRSRHVLESKNSGLS